MKLHFTMSNFYYRINVLKVEFKTDVLKKWVSMVKFYIIRFSRNNTNILHEEFFILHFVSSNRLSMTVINY